MRFSSILAASYLVSGCCNDRPPEPVRIVSVCLPESSAPSDTPLSWPIEVMSGCGAEPFCRVELSDEAVDLTVGLIDRSGGDACLSECHSWSAVTVSCELPSMASGSRLVRVNAERVAQVEFEQGGLSRCESQLPTLPERRSSCVPIDAPPDTPLVIRSRFEPATGGACSVGFLCTTVVEDDRILITHRALGGWQRCTLTSPGVSESACEVAGLSNGLYRVEIDGVATGRSISVGTGTATDCEVPPTESP